MIVREKQLGFANGVLITLLFFLAVAIAAGVWTAVNVVEGAAHDKHWQSLASQIQLGVQETGLQTRRLLDGHRDSKAQLDTAMKRVNAALDQIGFGTDTVPPAIDELYEANTRVRIKWEAVERNVAIILDDASGALNVKFSLSRFRQQVFEMQSLSNRIVERMVSANTSAQQAVIAQRQTWLAERIAHQASNVLNGTDSGAAQQLASDARAYGAVLQGLWEGNPRQNIYPVRDPEARRDLQRNLRIYRDLQVQASDIGDISSELLALDQAGRDTQGAVQETLGAALELSKTIGALEANRPLNKELMLTILAVIVALLVIVCLLLARGLATARPKLAEKSRAIEPIMTGPKKTDGKTVGSNPVRDQAPSGPRSESVLEVPKGTVERIENAISAFASGRWHAELPVYKGPLAGIENALGQLAERQKALVSQLVVASNAMEAVLADSNTTAQELDAAVVHERAKIAQAKRSMGSLLEFYTKFSDSVTGLSSESERIERALKSLSDHALSPQAQHEQRSLQAKVLSPVQANINRLQANIAQLEDVIGNGSDLAGQTQILALNAAIQASLAGDHGRGFASVADEFQRLAERATNTSQQTNALARNLRRDVESASELIAKSEQQVAESAVTKNHGGGVEAQADSTTQSHLDGINSALDQQNERLLALSALVSDFGDCVAEADESAIAASSENAGLGGDQRSRGALLDAVAVAFKPLKTGVAKLSGAKST